MTASLIDSNVIIDVLIEDPVWHGWSEAALAEWGSRGALVINPLIYAEIASRFETIADLEQAITDAAFDREQLPWEAAFLAGKAFLTYRRGGGSRCSPLPDFYIGAHAAVRDYRLLTRDAARYRGYFPTVELIAP